MCKRGQDQKVQWYNFNMTDKNATAKNGNEARRYLYPTPQVQRALAAGWPGQKTEQHLPGGGWLAKLQFDKPVRH